MGYHLSCVKCQQISERWRTGWAPAEMGRPGGSLGGLTGFKDALGESHSEVHRHEDDVWVHCRLIGRRTRERRSASCHTAIWWPTPWTSRRMGISTQRRATSAFRILMHPCWARNFGPPSLCGWATSSRPEIYQNWKKNSFQSPCVMVLVSRGVACYALQRPCESEVEDVACDCLRRTCHLTIEVTASTWELAR